MAPKVDFGDGALRLDNEHHVRELKDALEVLGFDRSTTYGVPASPDRP